jgi:aryl-alcohol dehydrogenase-like predicted oxidoreductase
LKAEGDHAEYYRRMGVAFEHLESEVAAGRIQYYGVSSNTFPEDKESSDFTSLQVLLEIARELGAKHFKIIQFPLNLYEPDAVLNPNNVDPSGDHLTVVELAERERIATLINRPLNAFYGRKLIRLASFPSHADKDVEESLKESFLAALQTESDYPGKAVLPANKIAWAHILRQNFEKIHDLESWKSILSYQIEPSLQEAFDILGEHDEFQNWLEAYRADAEQLFMDITHYLEEITSALSKKISRLLDETCPKLKTSPTLSQKVIRVYRALPGIEGILVGMRKPEYVQDMHEALRASPALTSDEAYRILEAVQHDIEEGEQED